VTSRSGGTSRWILIAPLCLSRYSEDNTGFEAKFEDLTALSSGLALYDIQARPWMFLNSFTSVSNFFNCSQLTWLRHSGHTRYSAKGGQ
jgi:hypothetical protein